MGEESLSCRRRTRATHYVVYLTLDARCVKLATIVNRTDFNYIHQLFTLSVHVTMRLQLQQRVARSICE